MHTATRKIYRFDIFVLDPDRRRLVRDGEAVHLPAKAFDLLVVLAESEGRLMHRDELFELLWTGEIVEESNLSVNVSALRKALGDRKGSTQYILTIPRQGYRFVADISIDNIPSPGTANGHSGEALLDQDGHTHISIDESQTRSRRRAWIVGGLICLLLAAAGFSYWRLVGGRYASGPMTIKRLTSHGKVVRAAISPDGKYFAYVREDADGRGMWLGQTSDGGSLQLRPPAEIVFGSLVFSPDGNSIYCVGTTKGKPNSVLYRMSVLGTATETVLERINSVPAFSPDGRRIAFIRFSADERESSLIVANALDGSGETVLASRDWGNRFSGGGISWSPDGKLIAVTAFDEEGDEPDRAVVAVSVADGSIVPITKQKWNGIHRLSWLNDGSGIVMVATDRAAFEWLQLWHLSYPGGDAKRITRDLITYNQSALSLTADNTAMIAVQLQQINNVWLAPADDLEAARQITFGSPGRLDGAYGLEWAPDGALLYAAFNGEGMAIWKTFPGASEATQITPSGYVERRMTLTADGRYLIFESNRSGRLEIWRSDIDGGNPIQLSNGGNNHAPHVTPDGRWVFYSSVRKGIGSTWRVGLDGSSPEQLTDKETDWPRVSPDGKVFACFYRERLGGKWQLAIFDIKGGPPMNLFPLPDTANMRNGPRWTPDGSAITYRDWKEGLWQQPLSGGPPEKIPGLPKEKIYPYAWSPDGKQFAFTRGSESYDVVLITDFK